MFEAVLPGVRRLRVIAAGHSGETVLRTAKSCGPGAPMQALSLAQLQRLRESDGGKTLVHRGATVLK